MKHKRKCFPQSESNRISCAIFKIFRITQKTVPGIVRDLITNEHKARCPIIKKCQRIDMLYSNKITLLNYAIYILHPISTEEN